MLVGMVANAWAELEHDMVHIANALLRTSDYRVGKIVMVAANPPQKRDLLLAMASLPRWSQKKRERVQKFCAEFERLRKLRNDIVHGYWDTTVESDPALRLVRARTELKETATPRQAKWIMQSFNDIQAASDAAIELGNYLGTRTLLRRLPSRRRPH